MTSLLTTYIVRPLKKVFVSYVWDPILNRPPMKAREDTSSDDDLSVSQEKGSDVSPKANHAGKCFLL